MRLLFQLHTIAFLLCLFNIRAQEVKVVSDFRLHGEVCVEKELGQYFKTGIESAIKLERDASVLEEISLDAFIDYKPARFINLGIGYRLAFNRNKNDIFKRKHRYSAQCILRKEVLRTEITYRVRYQNIDDDFFQPVEEDPPENILRNRLGVSYNIRKFPLDPYSGFEIYSVFGPNQDLFTKFKITTGLKYDLAGFGDIKIFYRIDREISSFHPFTYHNLGAGYCFKF